MSKTVVPNKIASAVMALMLVVSTSLACVPRAHAVQGGAQLSAANLRVADASQAFLVPVSLWKAASDDTSMAAPVLYKTAYVRTSGEGYVVKLYFVAATIMASTIYPPSLGDATYDKAGNGSMVPVDSDVYDSKTQVRAVTLTCGSLDAPVTFHMERFMDDVRIVFDASRMTEADGEPVFEEVSTSDGLFPVDSTAVIGGSEDDTANALVQCANGTIVVAGETKSTDQDFSGRDASGEQAYLSLCSAEGEQLSTTYLSGADSVGVYDLAACDESGFFACGQFQMGEGAATGDFEGLTREGSEGTRNGFVAKCNANGALVWVRSICCSQACQFDGVAATSDGGCVAVAEYLKSSKGDYVDEIGGLVNTVVVKYDASGSEEWHTVMTGAALVDTDGAIEVAADGSCLIAGSYGSVSEGGMLSGLGHAGGTFDIYVAKLDAHGKFVSARSYSGSGTNETVTSLAITSDGGFVSSGYTTSTDGTFATCASGASGKNQVGFVMKCDSAGAVEWIDAQVSNRGSKTNAVVETTDGYVAIGNSEGKDGDFAGLSKGQKDAFVVLYDKVGTRTSLRTFGGTENDVDAGIAALEDGRYVFLVETESTDVDLKGLARGGSDAVLAWSGGEASGRPVTGEEREVVNAHTVASVKTAFDSAVYSGKEIRPALIVKAKNGSVLPAGSYDASWKDNVNAGTATVLVTGKGGYSGTAQASFTIAKAAPAAKAAVKSKTCKAKSLKKKKVVFAPFGITTDGSVAYRVVKSDPKKVLKFKNGKVTVKKGAKKGAYSLRVKVSAQVGRNYEKLSAKTFTVKVRVK